MGAQKPGLTNSSQKAAKCGHNFLAELSSAKLQGDGVGFRQLAYLPDRRSTRVNTSIPILVRGLDASQNPYSEAVSALTVNCHGCCYLSRNRVVAGQSATLEIASSERDGLNSSIRAHVRSVQRSNDQEGVFDVAVELDTPRNIWGLASPPEDWDKFSRIETLGNFTRELQIVARRQTSQASGEQTARAAQLRASSTPCLSKSPVLPPLVSQIVASLREGLGTAHRSAHKEPTIQLTDPAFDQVCLQLEGKVRKAFEDILRNLASEVRRHSGPTRTNLAD